MSIIVWTSLHKSVYTSRLPENPKGCIYFALELDSEEILKWRESESESEGVDRNVIIVIFHVTKCNEQGMDKACAIDTTGGCNKIAVKVTY